MSSKESTTININVSGGNDKQGDIYGCPRPWPWPIPFPFPPYPFPFPFPGGGPLLMTNDFGRKIDELFLEGMVVAANLKLSEKFDKDEMGKHLRSKVLPKLIKASSLKDVDEVMSKAYKGFDGLQEFVHGAAETLSNGKVDEAEMAVWIWWLIRIILALLMLIIPSC